MTPKKQMHPKIDGRTTGRKTAYRKVSSKVQKSSNPPEQKEVAERQLELLGHHLHIRLSKILLSFKKKKKKVFSKFKKKEKKMGNEYMKKRKGKKEKKFYHNRSYHKSKQEYYKKNHTCHQQAIHQDNYSQEQNSLLRRTNMLHCCRMSHILHRSAS